MKIRCYQNQELFVPTKTLWKFVVLI